jgi:hypothetical protein
MAEEFSENQLSVGTPSNDEKNVTEQAEAPTKLASGDVIKKAKRPDVEPAIDKRVDQAALLDFLCESISNSVDARQDWQNNLEVWYRQYKGVVGEKDFPWEGCSNLHIPITGIIVDTLVSRMINPIFGVQPLVTARGVSEEGPKPPPRPNGGNDAPRTQSDTTKASDVENMLDFVLSKRIQVYPKIQDWIREAFIYGRGTIKVMWRKDVRKYTRKLSQREVQDEVKTFQDKVGRGEATAPMLEFLDQMAFILANNDWAKKPFVKIEREEVVYNNPDWEFIPIEDFIYHPRAITVKDSPYVAHRFRRDYDTLLKAGDAGMYTNVEMLNVSSGDTDTDGVSSHGESLLKDVQTLDEGYEIDNQEPTDGLAELELIEFHGRYDIDGDGRMEDIIATFSAKHKVLLSARESDLLHGKKPFAEIRIFPIPGRFESQGVPEIISDLQQELNDIHNMRIDNGTITNATMFWYDPNSDVDPEIHRPGPGVGFPAGPNQIGILQTGDVKFSSFREEELVRRLIQDRIGVSDFAIGNDATAGQNKTATGVNAIVNEGNQRLEMMLRNVAVGVNEAVLQTLQLLQQFGEDEMFFRVVEGAQTSMRKVTAKEIQGQYDIDISANSVNSNRFSRLNEIQQQLELALRAGPQFVNVSPLIKEFMRMSGSKISNEVAVPVNEAVMRMAQENPAILQALYQQVTAMAQQAGIAPPPQPQGGDPASQAPQQPQAPQGQAPAGGGLDIQALLSQAGPIIQQILGSLGGGGGQPQQGQPLPPQRGPQV